MMKTDFTIKPIISFLLIALLLLMFPQNLIAGRLIDGNCALNKKVFDKTWERYSDFDERIPLKSRSVEAQKYYRLLKKKITNSTKIYLLKRDMEIDRLMRLELREYKKNLVNNIRTNLLKSFWRLSYVTYDTIKGASSLGNSYEKLFTNAEGIEKIGAGLKVMRGLTPAGSKTAINTNKIRGKVASVQLSGALELLESMGNPKDAAKAVFDETVKQTLPSADLTPEEIEILRRQHLKNSAIDKILEKSYRVNQERKKRVNELEAENALLDEQMNKWRKAEKDRLADAIVSLCKKRKKEASFKEKPETAAPVKSPGGPVSKLSEYDKCQVSVQVYAYFKYPDGMRTRNDLTLHWICKKGSASGDTFTGELDRKYHSEFIRGFLSVTVDPKTMTVKRLKANVATKYAWMEQVHIVEAGDLQMKLKPDPYNFYLSGKISGAKICNKISRYEYYRGTDETLSRYICNSTSYISVKFEKKRP